MASDEPSHKPVPDHDMSEQDGINAEATQHAETAQVTSGRPVQPSERIETVDVLRGFALLGILTMNIAAFAWPMVGYENPRLSGGDDVGSVIVWFINSLVFSGKMMSLFSMLFGAGLVLMADRASARGSSILGTYYRRILWLLVFGIIHAYLIWAGDILFHYALCGLVLYLFRRRSPRTLIIVGVILLAIGSGVGLGFMLYAGNAQSVAKQVDEDIAAGRESAQWQVELHRTWKEDLRTFFEPDPKEIELYRGGYIEIVQGRAAEVLMFQLVGFVFFMFWGAGGRMLLGMALMKLGVFSAERSWRFYRLMALLGYGFGLPLTLLGTVLFLVNEYDALSTPFSGTIFVLGMVPVALGHTAIIVMICKAGVGKWLTRRLADVGRMALTNYLMQSLMCTTLFYGYGFGLFGYVNRVGLWIVVLAVWVLQLAISPIWLKYFRYGPAEWLWRTLTYWRWQPMRNCETA